MEIKQITINSATYGPKVVTVDSCDYDEVIKRNWSILRSRKCYYAISKGVLMHRLIMGFPSGKLIDHKDGNGLNNQRSNLRLANTSQNAANCRIASNNTSGFKGVSYHKNIKRFQANVYVNNKSTFVGSFSTALEAAKAYNAKATELYGQFARLNDILDGD